MLHIAIHGGLAGKIITSEPSLIIEEGNRAEQNERADRLLHGCKIIIIHPFANKIGIVLAFPKTNEGAVPQPRQAFY